MAKQYDREYFDRWYRSRERVATHAEVRRKVSMAVTIAEYFLRRQIRSVLDVGCGEAAWLPHLQAIRPRIQYLGVDPSEYVVHRYGMARNIRLGSFGELEPLQIRGAFDLVICADVLHYVDKASIEEGVAELAQYVDGLAYIEVLTSEDDVSGDLTDFQRRPARWYREQFTKAGLLAVGPYCYLGESYRNAAAELEIVR
jgi:SAM-dependent methyltransferase